MPREPRCDSRRCSVRLKTREFSPRVPLFLAKATVNGSQTGSGRYIHLRGLSSKIKKCAPLKNAGVSSRCSPSISIKSDHHAKHYKPLLSSRERLVIFHLSPFYLSFLHLRICEGGRSKCGRHKPHENQSSRDGTIHLRLRRQIQEDQRVL